jgi:uncharacterized membrane protein
MALIDKYFSKKDLDTITKACSKAEENTSGEIRVSIFSKRPRKMKNHSTKDIALAEFYNLGMDKTRDKTGILLFILLKERKFQILADSGINSKVEQKTWDDIANKLSEYFRNGNCVEGGVNTVAEMGKILSNHFPKKADDWNELSDEVSVR